MSRQLTQIALLVPEYDEAIEYYTKVLNFTLLEDTDMGKGKRWVVVSPGNSGGCKLLLARAKNPRQIESVGDQCGGRVFLFLHTDNFDRDYNAYKAAGVEFTEEPRHEEYGNVVVFLDRYGNKWDLIEPKKDMLNQKEGRAYSQAT